MTAAFLWGWIEEGGRLLRDGQQNDVAMQAPSQLQVAAGMGTGLCANQNMPSSTLFLKIVLAQEQAWWAERNFVLSATFPVL